MTKPITLDMGKKRVFLGIAITLALVIGFGWLITKDTVRNNWRLTEFANHLFDYPLPPDTEVIEKDAYLRSSLNGYCLYYAFMRLNSKSSKQAIEAYYADTTVPEISGKTFGLGEIPIDLSFWGYEVVGKDGQLLPKNDGETHFVLTIEDNKSASGEFEPRCP